MLTRRALLLGTLAGTAACSATGKTAGPPTAFIDDGSFSSAAMKKLTGWTVVSPPAATPLPMLLWLHGRGGDRDGVRRLADPLNAYVARGGTPFAIVGVDGGSNSYYHRRADGTDPQRMILEELLPRMADRGLRTDRFALGGVSMGGYGALLMTETLGAQRIRVCAVDSPAIFPSAGLTSAGSFDSATDFRAHDVIAGAAKLRGIPLRVACGLSDPFITGARRLLARVPADHDLSQGAHDQGFWRRADPAQIAFVGKHLS